MNDLGGFGIRSNSSGGGGGGGIVQTIVAGTNISVNSADPANPIVSSTADDITVVANFTALPAPASATGLFYWCSASQGTAWLPFSIGGTYYSAGLYYSNGVSWEFMSVPYQATQAEVDAGTNTNKFLTPDTFTNSTQLAGKLATTVPLLISTQVLGSLTNQSPSDSGTGYMGKLIVALPNSTATNRQTDLPTGVVRSASMFILINGVLGTDEDVTINLRNITDGVSTLIGTIKMNTITNSSIITGLSITTDSAKKYAIEMVAPIWATNPTNAQYHFSLDIFNQ